MVTRLSICIGMFVEYVGSGLSLMPILSVIYEYIRARNLTDVMSVINPSARKKTWRDIDSYTSSQKEKKDWRSQ